MLRVTSALTLGVDGEFREGDSEKTDPALLCEKFSRTDTGWYMGYSVRMEGADIQAPT